MAFKYAQIYAGTIEDTTGSIPNGVVTFFIINTGSAGITLTFTNGSTFTLEAGENFEATMLNQPYASIAIDATGSSVKYCYTQQ
jgi:hypothetical protein